MIFLQRFFGRFGIWMMVLGLSAVPLAAQGEQAIVFNRDIRPILSDKCFFCHGPDKNQRKAGLRLDVEEAAKTERDGLTAIIPGDPDNSEVIYRIFAGDENDLMPPPESEKSLTSEEKELLRKWIDQGASYQQHWAYIAPSKPEPPQVEHSDSVYNEIDTFIIDQVEENSLSPSEVADRRTLIRRLSLDLIGLPPSPDEVEAFVQDASPDAYAKVVERLLASKHFGERMAAPWLDIVRYADTVGFHGDQNQNVFPYRDYVIDAFNENKPYDAFIREQLAGDLLPNPSTNQIVATGFNRLNMVTREGGAQAKEYLAKYGADRVRTVSTTFLGSTFACAECHDHKFDPISMNDFYSLKAFFSDIKQWGVYADYGYTPNEDLRGFGNDHPFPPEIRVENDYLKDRIKRKKDEIWTQVEQRFSSSDTAAFNRWEKQTAELLAFRPDGWLPASPVSVSSSKETESEAAKDNSVLFTGKAQGGEIHQLRLQPLGNSIAGMKLEVLPDPAHNNSIARDGRNRFGLHLSAKILRADGKGLDLSIYHARADKWNERYRMGQPIIGVHERWESEADQTGNAHSAVYYLRTPVALQPGDQLFLELRSDEAGKVRISTSPITPIALDQFADAAELASVLKTGEENRTLQGQRLVQLAWLASSPKNGNFHNTLAGLHQDILECRDGHAYTQIVESREPREVRILPRGNWQDDSGEIVQPDTPDFLFKLARKDNGRLTRLDLADWITSTNNPLTARVFVNRLWKQYFGRGLSGVLDDLGSQGEWPTHPELLDWLAVEFMENDWDIKHMARLMVMSHTYRQTSQPSPAQIEKDPNNKWLARQSPRRLPAEIVRDNALAISGLLNPAVGGPSAHPYQPSGYYEHLNFPRRDYENSDDERQYRRGVYAHWQRTFLHPMMANFDAPSREECLAERPQSNTPQQALTLLNDPSFVEAARVFAEQLLKEVPEKDFGRRIELAFQHALARPPSDREKESLEKFLSQQLEHYSNELEEAKALLAVGLKEPATDLPAPELAAWTSVCRVVLNLHETITRL